MKRKLWVYYDDTPERLPLWVADSAAELARVSGRKEGTVRSSASRLKRGKWKDSKFAEVVISDE